MFKARRKRRNGDASGRRTSDSMEMNDCHGQRGLVEKSCTRVSVR